MKKKNKTGQAYRDASVLASNVSSAHSFSKHKIFLVSLVGVIVTAYFSNQIADFIKTSVIGFPEHAPYDGVVYPIQKVPDFVHLKSDKWKSEYAAFTDKELVSLPYYDPEKLALSTDSLVWSKPEDDKTRNLKITYSVPYMGNYLLDGKEYAGSHAAVDIKVPSGTPIYAMANGTVIKTSNQGNGFGNHVVLQHNNFPSMTDFGSKVTIYSSYSHLKEISVSQGDVVKKGQQIGFSGATGTATTPHLHFQIDTSDAPWHPFWPFTWKEAQDAGLDFFSAINAGLGKEKGEAVTINPLKYVQTYMDSSATYTAAVPSVSVTPSEPISATTASSYVPPASGSGTSVSTETASTTSTPPPENTSQAPVLNVDFNVNDTYYVGENTDFTVLLKDQYGKPFVNGFIGEMIISSTNGNFTSNSSIVNFLQFESGAKFKTGMKDLHEGKDKIKVIVNGQTYYSKQLQIADRASNRQFSDVKADSKYYEAVSYLVKEKVIAGYPDGTFKPDKVVTRVEALKFIFEGIKVTVSSGSLPFPDVSSDEWYGKYLYTAYQKGVVNGYPDGKFRPTNTVNKSEFYKILFNGMGITVNTDVKEAPFEDVPVNSWFAPYISYAKEIGLINVSSSKIYPAGQMTRGEVAYAIYKLMLKGK